MEPVRFLVVGAGLMGRGWWSRGFSGRSDVAVVGVADVNPQHAAELAATIGLGSDRTFASLATAIGHVQADAVLLVTPPAFHAPDAVLAFQHGLHVLTEKPIASTLAEARAMVDAAERAGRQLMVTHNRRYEDWAPAVRDLIAAGTIGRLGFVQAEHFIASGPMGGYRGDLKHIFLEDMAIHHLDLLRHLTGRNVVGVSARLHAPVYSPNRGTMAAFVLMDLDDGTPCTYTGSWQAPGRRSGWGADWRIQGETGAIHVNQDVVSISRGARKDPRTETPIEFPPTPNRGQGELLDRFLASIRTGQPAQTSGRDNLWTLAIIEAADESDRTGTRVEIRV